MSSSTTDPSSWKSFNEGIIAEFREKGGQVSGMFEGAPILLLTSTGAKSGKPFTTPLVYTTDGDRYVIIASKGGHPTHPDWFHNLKANPSAQVEVGTESFRATASIPSGEERQRLYDAQAAMMPNFKEYAEKTVREIPVVVLERQSQDRR